MQRLDEADESFGIVFIPFLGNFGCDLPQVGHVNLLNL